MLVQLYGLSLDIKKHYSTIVRGVPLRIFELNNNDKKYCCNVINNVIFGDSFQVLMICIDAYLDALSSVSPTDLLK